MIVFRILFICLFYLCHGLNAIGEINPSHSTRKKRGESWSEDTVKATIKAVQSSAISSIKPADVQYVLNFDSPVYVCGDELSQGFLDTEALQVRRENETTAVMAGIMTLKGGLDFGMMLEILVKKETNGKFDLVFSLVICDICEEIGQQDSQYKNYLNHFGFPETCPFEAKEYSLRDLVASNEDLPINAANSGRYQTTINIYKVDDGGCKTEDAEFKACAKLDLVVEQK